VDGGEIPAAEMKRRVADLERYRRESSGRRRGLRKAEFDYVSYHGDIVDALQKEREARKVEDKKVVNTKLIDLYVSVSGRKTEVFEVKTGIDRQSIYTAVGQLITHSGSLDASVRRFLVVPDGRIPDDLRKCIKTLGITVRRFRLEGSRNRRVVLL
jgi:hypothetical protein